MKKPSINCEVSVDYIIKPGVVESGGVIIFYGTLDAANEFAEFGELWPWGKDKYRLYVDGRYNFDEVLNYIKSYGGK